MYANFKLENERSRLCLLRFLAWSLFNMRDLTKPYGLIYTKSSKFSRTA